ITEVSRGGVDRGVEVELALPALAVEAAQLSQGHLEASHVEHEVVAVAAVAARVSRAKRAAAAARRGLRTVSQADARRVRAVGSEWRMPAGADPARTAVVPAALLVEPLLEEPSQLVKVEL